MTSLGDERLGVRVQKLSWSDQVLVLARIAETQSEDREFSPQVLNHVFTDFALPRPSNLSDLLSRLARKGLMTRAKRRGFWKITPLGRKRSENLMSHLDLQAFFNETSGHGATLGNVLHATIPPEFAPPGIRSYLRQFLQSYPFELNVFGMTRFPEEDISDPVRSVLDIARRVCGDHGMHFHLASDRQIVDDLWSNVAAHMWACKYGIAIFEDRQKRGVNYNLTIEVGAMLITGRRCALLKDVTVSRMPTDLVGQVYKEVDLDDDVMVEEALHRWLRDDLALSQCPRCPR